MRPRAWIAVLVVIAAAAVFHVRVLAGVARFMSASDLVQPADAILPLYQDENLPFVAADLYRRGFAARVVLGRMRPTRLEAAGLITPRYELWRKVLRIQGVPDAALEGIGQDLVNEVDLGRALVRSLTPQPRRVIVVTSAPFGRLARNDLRSALAGSAIDLRVYPVYPREFDERTWWRGRHSALSYVDAYYLWFVRVLRHELAHTRS